MVFLCFVPEVVFVDGGGGGGDGNVVVVATVRGMTSRDEWDKECL